MSVLSSVTGCGHDVAVSCPLRSSGRAIGRGSGRVGEVDDGRGAEAGV